MSTRVLQRSFTLQFLSIAVITPMPVTTSTPPASQNPIKWNDELIRRYDLAGPRYTSYPTAPQFHEGFAPAELDTAISRSNASGRPLSLYVHIPFCDTVCYYCACNKIITANKKRAAPYLERLHRELAMQAPHFDRDRIVQQLHWGGGTPTYISDDEKRQLMQAIGRHFNLLDDDSGEYSIEIHPGGLGPDTIGLLRELGFNRLSMGIQDFDPKVQKAVNRFNSVEEVTTLVEASRGEGFHSISMDLIYGLPHQSLQTIAATLDQVIELSPDRLSLFNYAHLPHLFKTQRQIDAGALPEPQEKLQMLHYAIDRLCEAGYVYIGMDHFAKPDDALTIAQQNGELQRNFQGYATHGNCDLVAFGVSAISAIDNVFVQNHKAIDDYHHALDNNQLPLSRGFTLSPDDQLRQRVINRLICHFQLDFTAIEQEFGIDFAQYFAPELATLEEMAADGLLSLDSNGLKVSDQGRLLIRRICMAFDAYLNKAPTATRALDSKPSSKSEIRYSRII